ncbi:hypothetical protein BGW80DRAFT_65126 [Lactifluus volemus]|nr:hypothetical protein BGW80DRAFT_65126 [Lactifluus volemus]
MCRGTYLLSLSALVVSIPRTQSRGDDHARARATANLALSSHENITIGGLYARLLLFYFLGKPRRARGAGLMGRNFGAERQWTTGTAPRFCGAAPLRSTRSNPSVVVAKRRARVQRGRGGTVLCNITVGWESPRFQNCFGLLTVASQDPHFVATERRQRTGSVYEISTVKTDSISYHYHLGQYRWYIKQGMEEGGWPSENLARIDLR